MKLSLKEKPNNTIIIPNKTYFSQKHLNWKRKINNWEIIVNTGLLSRSINFKLLFYSFFKNCDFILVTYKYKYLSVNKQEKLEY